MKLLSGRKIIAKPWTKKVGKRFNSYVVIGARFDVDKNGRRRTMLKAKCDCGNIFELNSKNVDGKRPTMSCGCKWGVGKHGHTSGGKFSLTYCSWDNMIRRSNKKYVQTNREHCKTYINLCNRGIAIDERWLYFENFLNDMGERPSKNHSIDRIDKVIIP